MPGDIPPREASGEAWDFSERVIVGQRIQLEPLVSGLLDEVCEAVFPDPEGWYSQMFGLNSTEEMRKEIERSERYRKEKSGIAFALRDPATAKLVGISSFLKIDQENRHLEIGTTIVGPEFRRTHINTATKLAMLAEAFETMSCIRVSFRVDEENFISRKAIERLGAKFGGVLRHERILPDGKIRNYRFYSIIDNEWPVVKSRLSGMLAR